MLTLYRLVLHLYPPAFRREYGAEMEQLARDLVAAGRGRAASRLAVDALRSIPREWFVVARDMASRADSRIVPPSRTGPFMRHLTQDIRFAFRLLARTPAFSIAAVATLGLGIGANTAIFSLADATLLRPIAVSSPEELVVNNWTGSYPDYLDFAERTDLFTGLMAVSGGRVNLGIDGSTSLERAQYVSGNAFGVLGVPAALGRPLVAADDAGRGGPVVAVLGYDYWAASLGSDPGVVGRVVRVNGTPVTIVGVTARGFRGTTLFANPAIYLPLTSAPRVETGFMARMNVLGHRGFVWLTYIGRLQARVSREQAAQALDAHYRQLHPPEPGERVEPLQLVPLATRALGSDAGLVRRFVALLMGVVGLTLLIGCANLANLLLARAAARRREVGVRLALGAGRGRVVQQMLVESVVLSVLGGALGLYLAGAGMSVLSSFELPGGLAISNLRLAVNGTALAATAALALLTGLLFGAAPAWSASREGLMASLRDDARAGSSRSRLRGGLVAAQVALSLVLLTGSGLFLRSLLHALDKPLGFNVEGVATASVDVGLARYEKSRAQEFFRQAIEQISALPGVTAAAWTTIVPTSGLMMGGVDIDGYEKGPNEDLTFYMAQTTSTYFRAAGTRVVAGRSFEPTDGPAAPRVVIVNQIAAEKYWPGRSPLGGRLRTSDKDPWYTVVGVVENTKIRQLDEEPSPLAYFAFEQPLSGFGSSIDVAHVFARTTGNVDALLPLIRERIQALGPEVPVYAVQPFSEHVRDLVMPQRMGVMLFGLCSLLALSLATIGIYGVASYVATLRRREIGIRMALGADGRAIGRLVLRQGLAPVVAGILTGLLLALWAGRLASGFLYEVLPSDPITFAAVASLLGVVALAASYIPARRAARIDPVSALRHD